MLLSNEYSECYLVLVLVFNLAHWPRIEMIYSGVWYIECYLDL